MDIASLVGERPVVIFSRSSCCISHSIKTLFYSFGANPKVYELDEIPNGHQIEAALVQMGCRPSVPVVFIGQKLVGGATAVMSLQVQSQLVPMLIRARAIWV
ncbi:hypothetical protein UlMin_031292 [Ulmus minor]